MGYVGLLYAVCRVLVCGVQGSYMVYSAKFLLWGMQGSFMEYRGLFYGISRALLRDIEGSFGAPGAHLVAVVVDEVVTDVNDGSARARPASVLVHLAIARQRVHHA